jgi:hypothetical protein
MVFQKELYNSIPIVTVWRVLQRLNLKVYKLSIVQHQSVRLYTIVNLFLKHPVYYYIMFVPMSTHQSVKSNRDRGGRIVSNICLLYFLKLSANSHHSRTAAQTR